MTPARGGAHTRSPAALRKAPINWHPCFRVTSWPARPEAVFEQVTAPEDLQDALTVLAAGAPAPIAPARAASGPGAGWVMLPFLRFGPSRFSDGKRYGVLYAGRRQATAIAETTFHYARFLAASHEPATLLGVQMLRCSVTGRMVDIRRAQASRPELYDPDPTRYGPAQQWADGLHRAGQAGIVYDSVRHRGGMSVAVFDPRCVTRCTVAGLLAYEWDGTAIVRALRMREVWRS